MIFETQDIINMIKGVKPNSMIECNKLTEKGLMKFTGNQWNENWDWVECELLKMSDESLFNLYAKYK